MKPGTLARLYRTSYPVWSYDVRTEPEPWPPCAGERFLTNSVFVVLEIYAFNLTGDPLCEPWNVCKILTHAGVFFTWETSIKEVPL